MKDVNKRENQKQWEKKFLKTEILIWEKKGKVSKTLHKTRQKEDWDQPQPWCFVAPTMSPSQWPTGGATVLKKKISQRIEYGMRNWESKQKEYKKLGFMLMWIDGGYFEH